MTNLISTLVGERINGAYWGSVAAPEGFIYGIPLCFGPGRVVKFDPVSKSMTRIGPYFRRGNKWTNGAITDSGIIYCPPIHSNHHGILKIDTNTDTVTVLDANLLPERGGLMWKSCAVALDGCIYFMPRDARRIMKLDPHNNDEMTSVGDDLGRGSSKYSGTVVGIDGCVYGLPHRSGRIIKYDPFSDTTSIIGEYVDNYLVCNGNGALGRDGCIYAITDVGQVLKIDTTNNFYGFVENSDHGQHSQEGWGDAILGIDGCIYWPPAKARRILKYDPNTNQTSLVGGDYGISAFYKWSAVCLASNGVIYCFPHFAYNFPQFADRILSIDPWKEFCTTVKDNIEEYPQDFGFLFERHEQTRKSSKLSHQTKMDHNNAAPHKYKTRYKAVGKFVQKIRSKKVFDKHTKPTLHQVCKINCNHAVAKFGREKVIEVLDEHMTPVNDFCKRSNLCPFMIVASYEESSVSEIYHFLRQDRSWVNGIDKRSVEVKVQDSALHVHGADKKKKKKKKKCKILLRKLIKSHR